MGSDNFIKWHRQHCNHWDYTENTKCALCNGIAYLDNQLEGLDHPAYFEDNHLNSCFLKNCFYCKGFMNLASQVEKANKKLKEEHYYVHVADEPTGWKVEQCNATDCKATIRKRGHTIKFDSIVPWWS